jgi:DNA end-binding protein Ku
LAKAIWKGTISFSLVQINVSVIPALGREQRIRLRELDPRDNTPVKQRKINARSGEEVPKTIRGYEIKSGVFVPITEQEIASALPAASRVIRLEKFVNQIMIPPVYFSRPYYLVPTGRRDEEAYALFYETLYRQALAGIAQVVMRTKQYVAAILPYNRILLMVTLRYPSEIIPSTDVFAVNEAAAKPQELELATRLFEIQHGEWQPGLYRDEYRDKILRIIAGKHKNGKVTPVPEAKPAQPAPANLRAQLRASLNAKTRTRPNAKRRPSASTPKRQSRRPISRKRSRT